MKKLLLRADDFGYSPGINRGILESIQSGLIKSVGLMTNLPDAQDAYDSLLDKDICLGLHVNVTVGSPLLPPTIVPSLVIENGSFKSSKIHRSSHNDFVILDEAVLEVEAQYQKFLSIANRKPDYIEVHAIQSENMQIAIKMVALKYGLISSPFPIHDSIILINKIPFHVYMNPTKQNYNPTSELLHFIKTSTQEHLLFVTHPGYIDEFVKTHSTLLTPRELEREMLVDPYTKTLLEALNITQITYKDIL